MGEGYYLKETNDLEAYDDNLPLKADWEKIRKYGPKRILYAHAKEKGVDIVF